MLVMTNVTFKSSGADEDDRYSDRVRVMYWACHCECLLLAHVQDHVRSLALQGARLQSRPEGLHITANHTYFAGQSLPTTRPYRTALVSPQSALQIVRDLAGLIWSRLVAP